MFCGMGVYSIISKYSGSVNPRENIGVKKVGLSIPCACDNYQEFVNQIQKSEEKLKQYFKEDL